MKYFTATLSLVLLSFVLWAQADSSKMRLPWKPSQKIMLNLKFADAITIEAWDKKEVFLQAKFLINAGLLNHAHIMDSIITDNSIAIHADLNEALASGNHCCDCFKKGMNYTDRRKNQVSICTEIFYKLYLPAGADLELETISGNIKIVNMKGVIEAETVSGEVDVVIASNQKADIELKTVMGRAYTYPEIPLPLVEGLRPMLSRKLKGQLNGGGKKIKLESVTGNVSLRSADVR